MTDWIDALLRCRARGERAVLVSVVSTRGSVPRGPGTRMVVTTAAIEGTIGGGRLEHSATGIARDLLAASGAPAIEQRPVPSSASLGQGCEGIANLVFEPVGREAEWIETLAALRRRGVAAVVATPTERTGAGPMIVTAAEVSGSLGDASLDAAVAAEARALLASGEDARVSRLASGADDVPVFLDPIRDPGFAVVLFGAGHVGRALADLLGRLPCRVTWVDERDAEFPAVVAANTTVVCTDAPDAEVAGAPAGAYFLVMTHTHALDEALAEAILARADFAYFGLIGSASKRRQFERRMAARGVPVERFARMTCPIGIPGIRGKDPATIAIAVAAQLLQAREQAAAAQGDASREARA